MVNLSISAERQVIEKEYAKRRPLTAWRQETVDNFPSEAKDGSCPGLVLVHPFLLFVFSFVWLFFFVFTLADRRTKKNEEPDKGTKRQRKRK